MNVYEKLQEARVRLQKMELKKSGKNSFAGYEYFELGDFLPQTQDIFKDLGLCGVVSYKADEAVLTITDVESEKAILITSPMGSANLKGCHEVQNIGAVETYQRRYLWGTAMEIVEHDAIDATTGNEKQNHKTTSARAKPAQNDGTGPEPDAEIMAQLNAAKDIAGLTKVMNALPQDQKRLYTGHFNKRMSELKKAA